MAVPKNGKKKKSLLKAQTNKEPALKVALEKGSSIGPYFDPDLAKDIYYGYRASGMPARSAQRSMIRKLKKMQKDELDEFWNTK